MERGLTIRPATEADAPALLEIYAPYVTETAVTFEYEVPTPAEFARRIAGTLERYPYLVAEREGQALGYAYAGCFKDRAAYDWAVETSIYLRRDCRGQGIGTRLYGVLEGCLARQGVLNLNACVACPEREDEYLTLDSLRFHEARGYRPVGRFTRCGYKFRRWYDMVWMEKHIGSHLRDQPPVVPFSNLI